MIFVKNGHSLKVDGMPSTFNRILIGMCLQVLTIGMCLQVLMIGMCLQVLTIGGMGCLDTVLIISIRLHCVTTQNNILIVTTVRRRNLTKLYFIHG